MKLKYLSNVSTLSYNASQCVSCGLCADVCPHRVFAAGEQAYGAKAGVKASAKARIIDKDACMECGACAKNCPANAISVSAGVGCAVAIIMSWFTGKEPSCGCDNGGKGVCC